MELSYFFAFLFSRQHTFPFRHPSKISIHFACFYTLLRSSFPSRIKTVYLYNIMYMYNIMYTRPPRKKFYLFLSTLLSLSFSFSPFPFLVYLIIIIIIVYCSFLLYVRRQFRSAVHDVLSGLSIGRRAKTNADKPDLSLAVRFDIMNSIVSNRHAPSK